MINNKNINSVRQNRLFYITSIVLIVIYSILIINFVLHDGLTTFASDSANYMLMALYLSPWKEATVAVQSLWAYQDYPPFFPLILAYSGAAHSMLAAHILTAIIFISALPIIYIFTRQCFATRWQALSIVIIFALSPSVLMNILGILSENLYILISFLLLILLPKLENNNIKLSITTGLLLSFLILTRTIGISMFAAFIIYGLIMLRNNKINKITYLVPILLTLIINLIAKQLHKSSVPNQYIEQFKDLVLGEQFNALIDAWFSSWQFYWVDGLFVPHLIVLLIGLFACAGFGLRLKLLKIDALYIMFYLLILLVWPHPGQALRFFYTIQALLLIYAFYFIFIVFKKYLPVSKTIPTNFVILLMAIVVLPSLAFSYNRYDAGKNNEYNHIKEFYRIPDLKNANKNAEIQNQMFKDFESIEKSTNSDDLVLYFEPTYIALLSNRVSDSIGFDYKDGLYTVNINPKADYIYLSRIHPRKTRENINGLDIKRYIKQDTETIWSNYSSDEQELISIFLKIKK